MLLANEQPGSCETPNDCCPGLALQLRVDAGQHKHSLASRIRQGIRLRSPPQGTQVKVSAPEVPAADLIFFYVTLQA